jgi:hypothetical protein
LLIPVVLGLRKHGISWWEHMIEKVYSVHGTWEAKQETEKDKVSIAPYRYTLNDLTSCN